MSEPDFDAPAVGPRSSARRPSGGPRGRRPRRRSWGLISALLVGGLFLGAMVGLIGWLALEARKAPPEQPEIEIAIAPPVQPPPAATAAPEAAPEEPSPTPQPPAAEAPPQAAPPAPAEPAPAPIPTPPVTTAPPATRVPVPAPDGLAPAPDNSLIERTADGLLPRIGDDGRKPWQVYARPFDQSDKRPRVALVIGGLGQSSAATEAAIQRLPGAVTLAFNPYSRNLPQWIELARAAGHEVLLTVPMEPVGYPSNDPGPHTLLVALPEAQNETRLHWLMSRFVGYTGVMNLMGSRFTAEPAPLKPMLADMAKRGLLFLDARSSLNSVAGKIAGDVGLPHAVNDRFIDTKASRPEIDKRLEELEAIARKEGAAVGIGAPYPVTIERVARWTQELQGKGIALAPVSAVVGKQKD
jgi:polysaccharide deacetylase 2 family uncharacterized protein YibQ